MSNRRRPVKLQHRQSWYRIENNLGANSIHLYDEIGSFGISAKDFTKDLGSLQGDVKVHINSPGGEVFDGIAIFQALQQHDGNVDIVIDGLAASAATIVAMAGDKVSIAKHAQMMIHESHAVGVGNAKDMRQLADLLDKCSDTIADTYADRAGGTRADWRTRMSAETWFDADEAVKAGLADEVIPGRKVRNDWNLTIFNYAGRTEAPDPFTVWAVQAAGESGPEPLPTPEEIAEAPIVDLTGEPDPPPEPETEDPATEPGFSLPDIAASIRELHEVTFDPAVLLAAVQIGITTVPAPADHVPPEQPAEEPLLSINLPDVRRALKEARL